MAAHGAASVRYVCLTNCCCVGFVCLQVAQQRYDAVVRGQPERLVSGSDDHTMFLWTPSISKTHVARMTGHVQLINQVRTVSCEPAGNTPNTPTSLVCIGGRWCNVDRVRR